MKKEIYINENIKNILKNTQKFNSLNITNKISAYLNKYKDEEYSFTNTKKRTALCFIFIYITKLSLDEVLELKVKHLKQLIDNNYFYFYYKSQHNIVIGTKILKISNFDFLYNDIIKNKDKNDFLFSSVSKNNKLRKKNIIKSLTILCMDLKIKTNIDININDFNNVPLRILINDKDCFHIYE
jgi:hypothetical protein